jgi:hypothetical protein
MEISALRFLPETPHRRTMAMHLQNSPTLVQWEIAGVRLCNAHPTIHEPLCSKKNPIPRPMSVLPTRILHMQWLFRRLCDLKKDYPHICASPARVSGVYKVTLFFLSVHLSSYHSLLGIFQSAHVTSAWRSPAAVFAPSLS